MGGMIGSEGGGVAEKNAGRGWIFNMGRKFRVAICLSYDMINRLTRLVWFARPCLDMCELWA
jgi:hypothetical protein